MNSAAMTWSSDGKVPYSECVEDVHVFCLEEGEGWKLDGLKCECGKTEWRFKACEHCGERRGHAVPIGE